MNRCTNRAAKIFSSVVLAALLQGCGPGYFSQTLPPACASLGGRGSISVPACFHESREGEACDPQQVAKAKEDARAEQVAKARQAEVLPVASCR